MIVVPGTMLGPNVTLPQRVQFARRDGDVYNALGSCGLRDGVTGIVIDTGLEPTDGEMPDCEDVTVYVAVSPRTRDYGTPMARDSQARGFVRVHGEWREDTVRVIPVATELFSRTNGLLESDLLAGVRIAVFGQGSVGSPVDLLLAQSGVMDFFLMDDDRLEVCNVVRHDAGISHVGRYKTKYMAERIREKNPYARVETCEEKLTAANMERIREVLRTCDLVVSSIDEREGKLLLNRLCVEEGKTCIVSGAFRRAYGGQVLRVIPGVTACYQCFVRNLPEEADNIEISSPEQVEHLQYTDRPMPIEPGLAVDIAPINVLTAKLCIQQLLKGKETTLRSLDEDLIAHWFIYLNRREVNTQYEQVEPLGFALNGFRILRWYGVSFDRDPHCPVCGDYDDFLAQKHGIDLAAMDAAGLDGLSELLMSAPTDLAQTRDSVTE